MVVIFKLLANNNPYIPSLFKNKTTGLLNRACILASACTAMAASLSTNEIRGSGGKTFETLQFDNLALRKLPIDSITKNYVRQVPNACFSKVSLPRIFSKRKHQNHKNESILMNFSKKLGRANAR
jgi:hypothetical protein